MQCYEAKHNTPSPFVVDPETPNVLSAPGTGWKTHENSGFTYKFSEKGHGDVAGVVHSYG